MECPNTLPGGAGRVTSSTPYFQAAVWPGAVLWLLAHGVTLLKEAQGLLERKTKSLEEGKTKGKAQGL